jgi:quercetin dioxygenase-like cupin family protein
VQLGCAHDPTEIRMNVYRSLILACAPFVIAASIAQDKGGQSTNAKVTPLLTRALPDVRGKEAMMLTVEYPPGGSSPAHRHAASTFVYMLEGSVVMQVAGGKEVTLQPGDTFYESPTDIHSVSRNASKTQPAKFLVFFVKDEGAPASSPLDEK